MPCARAGRVRPPRILPMWIRQFPALSKDTTTGERNPGLRGEIKPGSDKGECALPKVHEAQTAERAVAPKPSTRQNAPRGRVSLGEAGPV